MRKLSALFLIPLVCAAGCGGGGGGGSSNMGGGGGGGTTPATAGPPNVESVVLDGGPSALTIPSVNTAFVSVKVCAPGTSTCQTIDHVEIDTGSVGLRLIAAGTPGGELPQTLLPAQLDASNHPLAECLAFADGSSWGSLAVADVILPISGEKASGVIVQIIGSSTAGDPAAANPSCVPAPPLNTENTVTSFGANGILGVGPFINDCDSSSSCPPGTSAGYYSCPTPTTCTSATATLAQQVQNPVTKFAADNNGVILELPSIGSAGAANPSGALLVFGIGTQDNNGLGSATQLMADPNTGFIGAMLNGTQYTQSYLDSGSNGNFFATTALPACAAPNAGFYCPSATTAENATLGPNNLAADFNVGNADAMFQANPTFTAFPELGGGNPDSASLDLGLPFFFGRHIYTGFENTTSGSAPYFAY